MKVKGGLMVVSLCERKHELEFSSVISVDLLFAAPCLYCEIAEDTFFT